MFARYPNDEYMATPAEQSAQVLQATPPALTAVRTGGLRKAIKAMSWVHTWAVARADLGHDPTAEEVAAWWNQPIRSTYRDQAAFRARFPNFDTPAPIADQPEAKEAAANSTPGTKVETTLDTLKAAGDDRAVLDLGFLPVPPNPLR